MGVVVVVFALVTVGYFVGVWTACLVFREPQRAYEDGVSTAPWRTRRLALGDMSRPAELRS
jgi:hypothetical protein